MTAVTTTVTDARLRAAQRWFVAAGVSVSSVSLVLLAIGGLSGILRSFSIGYLAIASVGVIVWVGSSSQPGNRLLWMLSVWVFIMSLYPLALLVQQRLDPAAPLAFDPETQVPADLDPPIAHIEGLIASVGTLAMFSLLTLGFLLFPDGRLPSARWRWVAVVLLAGLAASTTINYVVMHPTSTVLPFDHPLFHLTTPFILGGPVISIAGLIAKYRRSNRDGRDRIRWIFVAGIVAVPTMITGMISEFNVLIDLGILIIATGYGIAIVRHRLFDVNVVISRTLLFAALVGFITLVYAGFVAGLGTAAGGSSLGWSIVATAVVAVVFEPARHRLQRWVNRLVYGQRATPYEVLADLTGRLARTEREEGLLDRMATRVAEGTGADRVAVWAATPSGFEPVACEPPDPDPPCLVPSQLVWTISPAWRYRSTTTATPWAPSPSSPAEVRHSPPPNDA